MAEAPELTLKLLKLGLSVFRSDYLIREGADGQVQQRPSRGTEKGAEA